MSESMKKATATWSAELWVECPHCEDYQEIKFTDIDDWWCYFGDICESKNNGLEHEHECSNNYCQKVFTVNETEY